MKQLKAMCHAHSFIGYTKVVSQCDKLSTVVCWTKLTKIDNLYSPAAGSNNYYKLNIMNKYIVITMEKLLTEKNRRKKKHAQSLVSTALQISVMNMKYCLNLAATIDMS